MTNNFGKLYLIPTRLGDNPPLEVLPISVKKIIEIVDNYIVENEKTARGFIKKIDSRNGYIPIDKSERKATLKRLERLSFEQNQTQLFIETPYRNNKILEDICAILHPNTRVCIACDITLPTEYIKTMTVGEWKHSKVDLHKRPAIFIIHKD
jgi:16S rRNA C1402 (ribose-2'-O) methylase RsmI